MKSIKRRAVRHPAAPEEKVAAPGAAAPVAADDGPTPFERQLDEIRVTAAPAGHPRTKLPEEREAVCHKFRVGGVKGYLHVGFYPDGRPGELFIKMAKQGSMASGLCDAVGVLVSMLFQSGWSFEEISGKLRGMAFEPQGYTDWMEKIPQAASILDYVAQYLLIKFPPAATTTT